MVSINRTNLPNDAATENISLDAKKAFDKVWRDGISENYRVHYFFLRNLSQNVFDWFTRFEI